MMEYGVTERWMRQTFHRFGRFLARHPHAFLLTSLLVAGTLGGGLYFLKEEGSIEKLYTPENGPAKNEREYVRKHFPINDSEHFLPSRVITAGRYGAVIIRARGEVSDNTLERVVLDAAVALHRNISELVTEDFGVNYADVCAKWQSDCVVSGLDLLDFIANSFPIVTIGFPWTTLPGGLRTFSGAILGDVSLEEGAETVKKAGAFKLIYHLRSTDEEDDRKGVAWETAFLNHMATYSSDVIAVTWSTSRSLETEIAEMTTRAVPKLSAYTGTMLVAFAVLSCVMRDPVRSKPFLGMVGVLSAGMAVMATVGLFSYCRVMFNNLLAAMPFLVIGVGVDNMFILLAAWRKTNPWRSVEERAAETFAEAGVSITITALTNALAFAVGAITSFPGVRIFCLYSGVAVVFAYLFQINFFGACLIYDGFREQQNRHFLTCMRLPLPCKDDQSSANSCGETCCCAGDATAGVDQEGKYHNDHLLMLFFKNYYGPFVTTKWVKVAIIATFFVYIGVAIWGCTQLREGVPLSRLAGDDSYVARFLDQDDRYYSNYDVRVAVMVTERIDYWDPDVQDQLEGMLAAFEDTEFTYGKNESESWLRLYLKFVQQISGVNSTNKTSFMSGLKDVFLKRPGLDRYTHDIQFNQNLSDIVASRFFVQTKQIDSTLREKHMMLKMRELAQQAPFKAMVYHPAFVYYDQYIAILPNTLQNLGIATAAMLLVSLVLMPHPIHAVWVTLAIASICVGVVGYMTLWGTNLDSVSMISLIMCIGFSVDFSAHFIYSFVSAEGNSRDAKAVHALYSLGVPILQGSISTVLGVAALSTAPSYGFRTFFKTVFLVVVFGLLHGIVFLPAMLSCLGPKLKICCWAGVDIHRVAPAQNTSDLPELTKYRATPSFTITPIESTTDLRELSRERGASPFPIIQVPD